MSEKLPKLNNIVILRSFAIITVVLYHCFCPWLYAWNWYGCPIRPLYSFIFETFLVGRMPLFVFVSGYLFSHLYMDRGKYRNFKDFLINKTKRLLIPCVLFTGLMCLCLQSNYYRELIEGGYHLWFLKMLYLCFITTWVIAYKVHRSYVEITLLLIAIIMMGLPAPNYLGLSQYFKYYFFFYGGYLFYKYRNNLKWIYGKYSLIIVLLFFILLCSVCAIRYIDNPFQSMKDIIHSDKFVVICRILIRPITIILAFIIVDYFLRKKNVMENIFEKLNNYSYGIYLFHLLFLEILHKYFLAKTILFSTTHYVIAPFLYFIVTLSLSIACTSILKKTKWGVFLIG